MSQPSARFMPAPAAAPLMARDDRLGRVAHGRSSVGRDWARSFAERRSRRPSLASFMALTSPPEQKPLPAPVMTIARTSGLSLHLRMASCRSSAQRVAQRVEALGAVQGQVATPSFEPRRAGTCRSCPSRFRRRRAASGMFMASSRRRRVLAERPVPALGQRLRRPRAEADGGANRRGCEIDADLGTAHADDLAGDVGGAVAGQERDDRARSLPAASPWPSRAARWAGAGSCACPRSARSRCSARRTWPWPSAVERVRPTMPSLAAE